MTLESQLASNEFLITSKNVLTIIVLYSPVHKEVINKLCYMDQPLDS